MTNHYTDPFLCLGFIFYVNVRQKNASYRVNEMFLSCTSHSRLSLCWFYKIIYRYNLVHTDVQELKQKDCDVKTYKKVDFKTLL